MKPVAEVIRERIALLESQQGELEREAQVAVYACAWHTHRAIVADLAGIDRQQRMLQRQLRQVAGGGK